jgi:hypothetical protein
METTLADYLNNTRRAGYKPTKTLFVDDDPKTPTHSLSFVFCILSFVGFAHSVPTGGAPKHVLQSAAEILLFDQTPPPPPPREIETLSPNSCLLPSLNVPMFAF